MMNVIRKIYFVLLLQSYASCSFAQMPVSMTKQKNMAIWGVPGANYSGITRLGNNRYAIVSDKEMAEGFYVFDITINNKQQIDHINVISKPTILDVKGISKGKSSVDAEDIAFVPTSQTIFISEESSQRIREYTLDGQQTGRELHIPRYLSTDSIYSNYGFESLTYSPADQLLWTVTEHTLIHDGNISNVSNRSNCTLRLQSFDPSTCKPVSCHRYKTDIPTVKRRGRNYAFGVSALCALEDGSILVMEREFHVAKRYLGSWGNTKIYRTDPHNINDEGYLSKVLVTEFKTRLNLYSRNIANYEGMCLGPKLPDGSQTLLLISDSQDNYGNKLFHLKDYIKIIRL